MSTREIAERYVAAMLSGDFDALGELRHPEWTETWPQSGEVVRGHRNWVEITVNYPGGKPKWEISALSGAEQTRVITTAGVGPLGVPITITGGGDTFTLEAKLRYPNGDLFHVVVIGRVEAGTVVEQRTYYAAPFAVPEWRRRWVEQP